MTDLKKAAQQALKALEQCGLDDTHRSYEFEHAARAALRAALAQQDEPVAWYSVDQPLNYMTRCADGTKFTNAVVMPAHAVSWAYTAPPERLPLTEEEIDKIFKHLCNTVGASYKTMARAIERAHGIKE
jgi:hypothetical protein